MSVIQLKRGTAAAWTLHDPILAAGEIGVELDTFKLKLGNGTAHWSSLNYLPTTAESLGLENVDNTSDADKPVSTATQAALDDKADLSLLDGKANSVHSHLTTDVTGLDVALAAKADSTHGHAIADVSGLTTALDGKASSVHSHAQSDITGLTSSLNAIDEAFTAVETALSGKESSANKGQAGGYASLDGGGKVPVGQLPNSIMQYNGVWNASTNSPTLADGTGDNGDVYRVTVAGSRNLGSGSISFTVGDYVIYNGTSWEKADTTDSVATVNGYTGNVSLSASDVGLGNVDNTSDATKNSATATLTNKSISGSANTITNIGVGSISATGTASSSTFLRGDGSWAASSGISTGKAIAMAMVFG